MTMLAAMADYQHPPLTTNQSQAKLPESSDVTRLKKRFDQYRARQDACEESSHLTFQAQFNQSQETTRKYHERFQQIRAKKTNKRQRDSSGGGGSGGGPAKKKVSSTKSDASTTPGKDSTSETPTVATKTEPVSDDLRISEDLNLFDGIDFEKDKDFGIDINGIMTMIGDSSGPNEDCEDKSTQKQLNGSTYPLSTLAVNNNNVSHSPTLPSKAMSHNHTTNSPSPQLQQSNVPPQVAVPQYAPTSRHLIGRHVSANPAMYPQSVVKAERAPNVSLFNRSMSDAPGLAIQQLQQQQLDRQSSLPGEYMARQAHGSTYPNGMSKGMAAGHVVSRPSVDCSRQMSVPGATGAVARGYYGQGHAMAEYTQNPPSYLPYSGQYPQHGQPMTQEDLLRVKAMQQKTPLGRSNSHTGIPPYTDPRAYSMASEPALAMQQHVPPMANPMLQQGQQVLPSGPIPPGSMTSTGQYNMQARPSYAPSMHNGVPAAPLTRQLSNHPHLSAHEPQTLNAKVSNMQHAPAAGRPLPNSFPMTPQPTMMGAAPTYPSAGSMRVMGAANPAMMHQQHAPSSMQQHMSRPRSAGNSQVATPNQMIATSHSSSPMHSHALHRPPSVGVHPQMMTHNTSPLPQQSMTPQGHYMPGTHPQLQQQMCHPSMHPQHSMAAQAAPAMTHASQPAAHGGQPAPTPEQQLDLNDLEELILSAT